MAKAISNHERQDPAGKQETLAALEGHDADVIPTEDHTSQPPSYTPSLRSAKSAKSLRSARSAKSLKGGAAGHHEPLPADAAEKQAVAANEENGKTSTPKDTEPSDLEKEIDLEGGRHSNSTADRKDADAQPPEAEPADPNIVDWDGPDDPDNPLNWSTKKKWFNIGVMAAITFLTYAAFAPWRTIQKC